MHRFPPSRLAFLSIATIVFGISACQVAPAGGRSSGPDVKVSGGVTVTAGISVGDARALARQYGLTGAKPIPPGIAKNMARGKPMPPGIAKKQLPQNFVQALPRHPGYEWQQAGPDLVLVVSGTLVITDILRGVFD